MQKLLVCMLLVSGSPAVAAPLAHYDPGPTGFVDDAFAVSDDGKTVAFITTDGATTAELHLATVGGAEVRIEGVPIDAVALHMIGPDRILVVSGSENNLTASVLTPHGAEKQKLGPFNRLALARVDGKAAIVTYTRSDKKGVQHELVAYDVARLKPIKRKTLVEDAEGQIRGPHGLITPLWWSDGFTVLAARKPGDYDKAHDIRQPDRATRLEVFSGKILDEQPVQDVIAFAKVVLLRKDHPNEAVVVHFSDDRKQLLMLDGLTAHELQLARPLAKYDPQSLEAQLLDGKRVAMSLAVDPVNPEAVQRQKAEPDDIDLYTIDRQSQVATRILTLPGEGRRSRWQIAADRLVLLRKGKGFDRGGVSLEVYDLVATPAAANR
jgi:hypothetical protein